MAGTLPVAPPTAAWHDGGAFPDHVQSNAGVVSAPGETVTSAVLLEPVPTSFWHEIASTVSA